MTFGQWVAFGLVGLCAFIAFVVWRGDAEKKDDQPTPFQVTTIAANNLAELMRNSEDPPPIVRREEAPPSTPPMPTSATDTGRTKRRSISYTVDQTHTAASATAASSASGPTGQARGGAEGPGATTVTFQGREVKGARAGMAIDQALTLMPGIYNCTLDGDVGSDAPGPFFCHTSRDIKSPLNVTLMEAGTRIRGETQMLGGATAESRIVTLSAIAWTPEGIPVPLGGQMGDQSGQIGLTGEVNRHLWQRLQGAVILMLTQGSLNAATAALQGALAGNNSTFLNLNTGGVSGALAQALRDSQTIRNTITLRRGQEISFVVTEPISFHDVYTLTPTGGVALR
jgi:type IV secretion system protein VirB10